MKPIKVLFVTHHWQENTHHSSRGGYQELVRHFDRNVIPTVLTCGSENSEIISQGLHVITVKIPYGERFFKRFILKRLAAKISEKYDLIHALYDDVAPSSVAVPIVVTVHTSLALNPGSLWLKLMHYPQARVIQRAAAVITLSNFLTSAVRTTFPAAKVYNLPHGVDTVYFNASSSSVDERIPLNKIIFLTIGNYGTDRSFVQEFVTANPDHFFVIVNRFWKPVVGKNVLFLKSITDKDLLNFYSAADYLFRPLRFAAANNSILEALSMGVPILTTSAGVTEYVDPIMCTILSSPSPFAAKKKTPELSRKIEMYSRRYDWGNVAGETLKVYRDVLGRVDIQQ